MVKKPKQNLIKILLVENHQVKIRKEKWKKKFLGVELPYIL